MTSLNGPTLAAEVARLWGFEIRWSDEHDLWVRLLDAGTEHEHCRRHRRSGNGGHRGSGMRCRVAGGLGC